MGEEKTIIEWLGHLPQDIGRKALANMGWEDRFVISKSLANALCEAFMWCETAEGRDYWADVATKARSGLYENPNAETLAKIAELEAEIEQLKQQLV